MINTIEKIIITGKSTIKEVWDVMSEFVMQDKNLMTWISETFLHQLGIMVSNGGEIPYDDLF